MTRRFTKILAAFALLVFMTPSLVAWGQSRATKTEGFETATTGSDYQGTVTITENQSDCNIGWVIYYGCVSTSSKISGNNSAALRLYTSNNYGYIKTTTAIDGLSQVKMQAKASTANGALIKINVQYSIDGSNWTNIETDKTLTTSAAEYTFAIPSGGKYFQIAISPNSTKPSSKNAQLTIDDVEFTYGSTPTVMAPTISPEGRYFIDSKEVSITCSTEDASIYYTTDGNDPTTSSTLYTESFTVTETTTVKAIAVKADYENSDISTAVFTKVIPMSVAEAIAATPSTGSTDNVCIHGFVSAFYNDNATILDDYSRRYYISDDGTTSNQLLVYNGKGLNNEPFTNADDLLIGDEVNIVGKLKMYQDAPEVDGGNYIISLTRPEPEQFDLTVGNLSHVNIYVFNAEDQTIPLLQGEGTIHIYNGTSMMLSVDVQDGCELQSLMVDGMDVTSQIEADAYTFIMPRHNVSVTATAEVLPIYSVVLCDDNTTLTEASYGAGVTLPTRNGDETYTFAGWSTTNVETETTTAPTIIPVGTYYPAQNITLYPVYTRTEGGGGTTTEWHLLDNLSDADAGVYALLTEHYYAFNGEITNSTVGHGKVTEEPFYFENGIATSEPSGTLEITFIPVEDNNNVVGFKMFAEGYYYLYASKNSSGNLGWHQLENNYWSVHISGNWYYPTSNGDAYLRSYQDVAFRTYGSNNGELLKLAKKVEVTTGTTYYTSLLNSISLTIAANQWYLIASPVGNVNPIAVGSMTEDQTYGLFTFDQEGDAEGKEWLNYKAGAFSQLQAGKGYLYINEAGCILTFTGTANNNSTASATLVYSTSNKTESFHGLNLIGNPLNATAYLEDGRDFYVMNGNVLAPANRTDIAPMEGVFVVAENANDNSVTFTTTQPTNGGKGIVLNLSQNRGSLEDRAIVRFGEGGQLPKVQLFETNADLYIPQGDQNYAVVRSEGQGELPVNFHASENGTYTLSMDVENMDMNYLHLVDNMTGMDVDLLQTPCYTFEAKVNDYESRFRLVFAANNEDSATTGSTAFAFYSNGSWIINNAGEATLQVVDLTGRVLSSETVNGSVSKTINAVPGVYMLRLINGENVNVQKIVVR